MSDPKKKGEGNREADRRYREKTKEFIESEKVKDKAENARPRDEAEADSLKKAEERGKERAKEKDPEVDRDNSRKGSH